MMTAAKCFTFALISCAASFAAQPNLLFAQSGQRLFEPDHGVAAEALEIIPNPNLARRQNDRGWTDYRTPADYRTRADYQSRSFSPALGNRPFTDDFARRPSYRQPYQVPDPSTLEAERVLGAQGYRDRRQQEIGPAQFTEEGGPRFDRPQGYDRRQSGHRGCRGGSCGHDRRRGYDDGQPFEGPIPPYAEPPYLERSPSYRDEADLPPQLGVYRPSQRVPYRN